MPRRSRQSLGIAYPVPEGASPVTLEERDALPLLESGEITGGHRMPYGSNYTFLVWIDAGPGKYLRAIYKPRDGERPLWDFPLGTLYQRERAAFLLSRLLGWPNIPLTLVREGPYGIGMFQNYVDCDPSVTYFDMVEDDGFHEQLSRIMVFDLITNNADRKAGHCLMDDDSRIWSIDHGLTFHPSFKLRSVMMEFWGSPIPDDMVADLADLYEKLDAGSHDTAPLVEHLDNREVKALKKRVRFLLRDRAIPNLDPNYNIPWPFV